MADEAESKSGKKLKIGFYSHSLPPEVDGVSTRFNGILHEYDKMGHDCVVFTLRNDVIRFTDNFRFHVLDYSTTKAYGEKRFGSPYLKNFWKIYAQLRKEKPDIIHCVSDGTTSLFMFLGLALQIPVVVTIHTDVASYFKKFNFPKWFDALANHKDYVESMYVDEVGTTSQSFKNILLERKVKVTHVVKTGVDTDLFNKNKFNALTRAKLMFGDEDTSKILCTFVGRFSSEKNIIELIKIIEKVPNAYLALIGDGPLASDFVKKHGKNNRIFCEPRFASHPEVGEILASSDVHISASTTETLGNTVLESFACGTPVIVRNASGFKNTVTNGFDGYLYNDIDEAVKYLNDFIKNKEKLKEFGENAQETSKKYSIPAAAQDYIDWYARVLKKTKDTNYFVYYFVLVKAIIHILLVTFAWVIFFIFLGKINLISEQSSNKKNKKNKKA